MNEIYVDYQGRMLSLKSYVDQVTTKFNKLNITNKQNIIEEMTIEPNLSSIKIDRIYCGNVAIIEIEISVDLLNHLQLKLIGELCLRYGVCDFKISEIRKSIIVVYKSIDVMKRLLKDQILVINSIYEILLS